MGATSAHFWIESQVSGTLMLESQLRPISDYPAALGHWATGFKQLNGAGDSFTLFGSSGCMPG